MKWKRAPLADLCAKPDDIRCGPFGTQLNKDEFRHEGVPLWGIKQVNVGFSRSTEEFLEPGTAKRLSQYDLIPGDLVMTRKGTVGNCAVYPAHFEPGIMHSDLLRMRLDRDRCDPAFLVYQLHHSDDVSRQLSLISGGAIMPGINVGKLKQLEVLIPPLAEQKRIAGILDAADALRAKRRESLAQLDSLLQSTFLTLFGDPVSNPMGISKTTLETAFQFTTGKLDSNAATEGGKYPFFTCARETFAINEYAFDCEALLLAGNNANADYSVKHYKGKFNAYQRTYVINVDEAILTYEYAQIALEYMLCDLKRFSKGTNTKYLTMVILNRMPILVPSLDEQRRFAAIVESLERQKARQRAHLAELDALFASLQHRAFRGEL